MFLTEVMFWILGTLSLRYLSFFFFVCLFVCCFFFVFVFVNIGPYGEAKTSKSWSSLKSLLNLFKRFSNFLLSFVLTKVLFLDFLNFEFRIFNVFFSKIQIHHCRLWRNPKTLLSGKRAIIE